MKSFYNIESCLLNGKRIGYAKSTGEAIRIYGESGRYCVAGRCVATLAEVSKRLEEL